MAIRSSCSSLPDDDHGSAIASLQAQWCRLTPFEAMMQIRKIDVAAIEAARRG